MLPGVPSGIPQFRIVKSEQEEKDIFFSQLVSQKPWLASFPIKSIKLANLKRQFSLLDETAATDSVDERAFRAEVQYIQKKVEPKRHIMREKKSDEALLEDARFFNKHGDYLLKLMEQRSLYERLGIFDAEGVQ